MFVAGATGALGVPLVRRLVAARHEVVGLTRHAAKLDMLVALGAQAAVADALDAESIHRTVVAAAPDAVVPALTAIPKRGPLRPSDLAPTNALRVAGARHLLDAAIAAGARCFVAESMVFIYGFGDLGAALLTEETPPAETVPYRWLCASVDALKREEEQSPALDNGCEM